LHDTRKVQLLTRLVADASGKAWCSRPSAVTASDAQSAVPCVNAR
jgi:hypothetical protein